MDAVGHVRRAEILLMPLADSLLRTPQLRT
jgi:hypothetical protein